MCKIIYAITLCKIIYAIIRSCLTTRLTNFNFGRTLLLGRKRNTFACVYFLYRKPAPTYKRLDNPNLRCLKSLKIKLKLHSYQLEKSSLGAFPLLYSLCKLVKFALWHLVRRLLCCLTNIQYELFSYG